MPEHYTPAEAARTFVVVFHSSPRAGEILETFLGRLAAKGTWSAADVEETRRLILDRMPQLNRECECGMPQLQS